MHDLDITRANLIIGFNQMHGLRTLPFVPFLTQVTSSVQSMELESNIGTIKNDVKDNEDGGMEHGLQNYLGPTIYWVQATSESDKIK